MAITLDQVREDFASWRLVRKSRSRTPDLLRKKATDLLETHKLFHVAKALNVGTTELKRW
jgi:hypothetical protein